MAKGNPILGTASKSIGDIVLYRREGAQVTRVRVRKIANPKTDAQCLQRAFMSACVKFYQPLANVLDRSWQGKSRVKSYAAFLKTNAPKVRAAGYYINKGTGFFPLPLQVSNGTIPSLAVFSDGTAVVLSLPGITSETQAPATVGDLSTLLINAGYLAGDVVTFIYAIKDENDSYRAVSYQFVIDTTSSVNLITLMPILDAVTIDPTAGLIFQPAGNNGIGGTIIIARNVDGVWQRSTQNFSVSASLLATVTSDAAKTACIESYKGAAASDNPLVYLDGDELENA